MIAGTLVVAGSLFLPWKRVDFQELFGVDIPAITETGFGSGLGRWAAILALATAVGAVLVLALGPGRRRQPIVLAGLGCAVGVGLMSVIALFADAAPGPVVGLGGAVLSIIGGGVAASASRPGRRVA
ncbi:MAG: hypothetical protein M3144_01005 [Actinomycetota bacterium]|nr:hypothetical protein [Actinomycetota bacterium]